MKIISICNQKGGCAKTTTAVNLGASLASLGKRVLIIDNDPQGNLTQSLGVKDYTNTIYEVLKGDVSIKDTIIRTKTENVDVLPSSLDYANLELEVSGVLNKENLLDKIIRKAKLKYDFILIDCSPSLSTTVVNALVASHSVLIPLEASMFNFHGIGQLVKVLRLIKGNLNPNLYVEGVLLTRVDARTTLTNDFRIELEKIFQDNLFKTVIHQNAAIVRSQIKGIPVLTFDKNSKGAKEYLSLANEVIANDKK